MSSSTGENQEAASMSDNDEALNNSKREEERQNRMSAILQAPKTRETRTSETPTSWSSATRLPAKTRASIEKEEEIQRQDEQLKMMIESETASVVEEEPNPFQRETTLLASYLQSTGKTTLAAEATAHAFAAELDSNDPKEERSIQEKSDSGSAVESTKKTQSILPSSPYRRLSDLDNTKTNTSIKNKGPEAPSKRLQDRAEKMGALIRSMSSAKDLDDSEQANMEFEDEISNNLVPGAFPTQGRAFGGLPSWAFNQSTSSIIPIRPQRHAPLAFNQSTSSIPIRPQRHAPRRQTSHGIAMISNDDERPDEPDDDDVEDSRRYTESQQNMNVVSSAVTRLSNQANQSNQYEETQPEMMEPIEILEAKAVTVSDRFQYDDDDHEQPVFLATEIESTSTQWFKDKRFLKALVIFSISMCILVSLFVATKRETSDPPMSPMPSPTVNSDLSMSPTLSPTVTQSPTVNSDAIQMVLERFSKKEDLEQIDSPQRKALFWLANKDRVDIEFEDPMFPQRYALVVLFYATQPGNDSWLQQGGWLSPTTHECDWDESIIYCNPEITGANHVKELNLAKNGLAGTLPSEIGLLSGLETLILSDNTVQGTIPASIGALSLLTAFDLRMNKLTGIIPDTITNLNFLRYLNLNGNILTGTIPDVLYSMDQLKEIDLGENELTGTLSEEARNLKFLHTLRLSNNKLSGSVPTTLSELQDINSLVLDNNMFTGSIPDMNLLAFRLEVFSLSNNLLEGTIPINLNITLDAIRFDNVRKIPLRKIDISNNKLVGTLSPLIGYIAPLEHLDLSSNSFTGTIFTTLSIMDNLVTFRVSNNLLMGSLPQFSPFQRIKEVETEGNNLSHSFDDWILNQNQLEVISVSGRCDQSIPTQISKMTNLWSLNASNCDFGGTLPSSIGKLTQLAQLHLKGNRLSGPIPTQFENLNVLTDLNLDNNTLSGTIPQSLGNMKKLRVLSLANNQLTGPIPRELSGLQDLSECRLVGNSLEGPVPEEICRLDLFQLEVDSNIQCSCCTGDN